jgi:hypothetical protein
MAGEAGQIMDNRMFFITFPNVAYALQYITQSRNNKNRPNKKNDVITDLGGEGDFPMFLFTSHVSRLSHISPLSHLARLRCLNRLVDCAMRPQSNRETESSAGLSHE